MIQIVSFVWFLDHRNLKYFYKSFVKKKKTKINKFYTLVSSYRIFDRGSDYIVCVENS